VMLLGFGLLLVGLAAMWWPVALVAAGSMLVAGGLLAEVAESRRPKEDDSE